jgi:hypothetical protein
MPTQASTFRKGTSFRHRIDPSKARHRRARIGLWPASRNETFPHRVLTRRKNLGHRVCRHQRIHAAALQPLNPDLKICCRPFVIPLSLLVIPSEARDLHLDANWRSEISLIHTRNQRRYFALIGFKLGTEGLPQQLLLASHSNPRASNK